MIKYLLIVISLSLFGCSTPDKVITDINNKIETPYYSITVPPNRGWFQYNDASGRGNRDDLLSFKKTVGSNTYLMRFSTNYPANENMKSWTTKQLADARRNGERMMMIKAGVELKDVVMGEDTVGNKKFYTSSSTAIIAGKTKQRLFLYLHFPEKKNSIRFLSSVYSEGSLIDGRLPKSLKSEFLATLHSLEMPK